MGRGAASSDKSNFGVIKRGTRFGCIASSGKILWESADRDCPVQYQRMVGMLAEVKIQLIMVGPEGPLPEGSIVLVEPDELLADDDTQRINQDISTKHELEEIRDIIVTLQEKLYDLQACPYFWFSPRLRDRADSLRKRLGEAKKLYARQKEQKP
jgi:hypothetical protein